MRNEIPRILIVNEQVYSLRPFLDRLEVKGLNLEIQKAETAFHAREYNKSQKFDIAIIDVSDNIGIEGKDYLSEYLREKNPEIVIVGTSVQEGMMSDKLAERLYDERECLGYKDFDKVVIDVLKKYKFIPEGVTQ